MTFANSLFLYKLNMVYNHRMNIGSIKLHVKLFISWLMFTLNLTLSAEENLHLTIASSHYTNLPWVGTMHTLVVPDSHRKLREMGSDYRII